MCACVYAHCFSTIVEFIETGFRGVQANTVYACRSYLVYTSTIPTLAKEIRNYRVFVVYRATQHNVFKRHIIFNISTATASVGSLSDVVTFRRNVRRRSLSARKIISTFCRFVRFVFLGKSIRLYISSWKAYAKRRESHRPRDRQRRRFFAPRVGDDGVFGSGRKGIYRLGSFRPLRITIKNQPRSFQKKKTKYIRTLVFVPAATVNFYFYYFLPGKPPQRNIRQLNFLRLLFRNTPSSYNDGLIFIGRCFSPKNSLMTRRTELASYLFIST